MDLLSLFGSFVGPGVLVRDKEYGLVSMVRGHPLGEIAVPSGRLRVADAWSFRRGEGREVAVPVGRHPVTFAASEMDAGHDGLGLLVRVRPGPVARWARAGVVAVDGAAFAVGDAEARLAPGRLDFDDPRGATRLGKSVAVARIGSDGGYPLRVGFDARDRVAAVAIVTHDPRGWVRFRGGPRDLGDLAGCLAWARDVGGEDALVRPGVTDVAPLRALRRIPRDLARYYRTHDAGDLVAFRAAVERHGLGRALPVVVDDADAFVYLDAQDRVVVHYQGSTLGVHLDLRAWVVLSSIATLDLTG